MGLSSLLDTLPDGRFWTEKDPKTADQYQMPVSDFPSASPPSVADHFVGANNMVEGELRAGATDKDSLTVRQEGRGNRAEFSCKGIPDNCRPVTVHHGIVSPNIQAMHFADRSAKCRECSKG
jgi:hypothetical protein